MMHLLTPLHLKNKEFEMNKITVEQTIDLVNYLGDVIISNEVYFCELDSAAGDGDFGMSVAKGFRMLKEEWDEVSKDNIGSFLKDTGMIITEFCGGASGPIWGSAFRAAGRFAADKKELDLSEFSEMMASSVLGIQKRGKAELGDKTLLDALIPTVSALKASALNEDDFLKAFDLGACAAREGAEKTKSMVAKKGRASYVGERSLMHPDAGAMALGVIFTELSKFMAQNNS